MKKSTVVASSILIIGSLLLSACSDNGKTNTNQPASNASGNTGSANTPATDANQGAAGVIAAADLTKLPDAAKKRTDTIIVGLIDPSGAFTPYFQKSGYDGNVSLLLYTPLVEADDNGEPIPGLAEKWDVSADGLTYTFHLRKDLKFSDGSPLTADDVAFTWTILNDKSYDGDSQVNTLGIKGADAYKAGTAKSIAGIQVTDPQTISVQLTKANATALLLLGSDVLSKAYYGKDYKQGDLGYMKQLSSSPVGTGPYKLEKFIPGQEVRFAANENYYGDKPKTPHFIYKTSEGDTWQYLETGEVDYASFSATEENIDKLKSLGYLNIVPYTPSTYGYLQVNLKREALKDKKVRQALTYGLDRQSIYVEANQGAGQVANIPSALTSWAYTEDGINTYSYDLDKAKSLLDEAGWKVGSNGIREKDGKKLKIHYLGNGSASRKKDSETFIAVAKENYQALGVDFQPELFADFNSLISKVEGGDYDLVSFSTSQLLDPSDGLLPFVDGEIEGYDNPKFKELYEKGLASTSIDERKEIYKQIFQLMNDDLPVIFTNYKKSVYAYNGRIENLKISPFYGLAQSLPQWSLKNVQ